MSANLALKPEEFQLEYIFNERKIYFSFQTAENGNYTCRNLEIVIKKNNLYQIKLNYLQL